MREGGGACQTAANLRLRMRGGGDLGSRIVSYWEAKGSESHPARRRITQQGFVCQIVNTGASPPGHFLHISGLIN